MDTQQQKVLSSDDGDVDEPRCKGADAARSEATSSSTPVLETSQVCSAVLDLPPRQHYLDDAAMLEDLLSEAGIAASLTDLVASERVTRQELRGLRQLVVQSVVMSIDYKTLGLGWHNPQSRIAFRKASHPSITHPASRLRAEQSKLRLVKLIRSLADESSYLSAGAQIVNAFCDEISIAPEVASQATVEGGLAALEAELLLPLRALTEDRFAGKTMARTFNGDPLPADRIEAKIDELTAHVLDGTYSVWRYSNRIGARQLEGLTDQQLDLWMEPTRTEWEDGIVVHEDEPGELGFFWATKIGGPSHGFDLEGQCLLPLLCNARHKVVLVSSPDWPHYPSGRAHFRLLWTTDREKPRPVLWFETVNRCFDADVDSRLWGVAVLTHIARKAEAMDAILSVSPGIGGALQEVVSHPGRLRQVCERLTLRPSNAVVEASDYLGDHDWLQEDEQVTHPLHRVVYEPFLDEAETSATGEHEGQYESAE